MASRKSGLGKGLGKGLDSLIPDHSKNLEEPKVQIVEKVVEKIVEKPVEVLLKTSEIEPNRSQPRKVFNEDTLEELADSIKEYGVLQPLLVQKEDGYYRIIAGERRWRAAIRAGLKEVPVIIKDYNSQQIVEISLIENIQREDLNPIEEAMAYQKLLDEFHLKQEEVANRVSKSRAAIANSLRLLKLDKRVQEMLVDDMISSGHGRTLLPVENNDEQYNLALRIIDEKLSVRETEKLVKQLLSPKRGTEKPAMSQSEETAYRHTEDKLTGILGSKVSIRIKAKDKGRIEIEYYSNEEMERIVELLEGIRQGV